MNPAALSGVVLDLAAVRGWCRRDPYPHAIAWATVESGNTLIVPATVLTAARAQVPSDQLDILAALIDMPHTLVPTLDRRSAADVGARLVGVDDADPLLSAAHAVHEGISRRWHVLTARPMVLLGINSDVLTDTLP
ncbi:hypothetical protein [Nocardia pseudobrasiliensis]|uniref:Twitching motility protein PilT n=1 Tax=Nocardia pseudobrasiliensis TaxID=45979 RepID=A0A370HYI6_9NOCA|nr:hypothetical protein [Nocardia pseudobrasiliensis]RDI63583.1 hypothetical protein DFR76_110280 [Nocardia pseudobrasiliensis]